MAWIADAHREWHTVYGQKEVCPLDCGAGETYYDYDPEEVETTPMAPTTDWEDIPF
jgi:hypothetical protein